MRHSRMTGLRRPRCPAESQTDHLALSGGYRRVQPGREMAGLDPELASVRPNAGIQPVTCRKPEPRLQLKCFAAFVEAAFQHQELAAALSSKVDTGGARKRCYFMEFTY